MTLVRQLAGLRVGPAAGVATVAAGAAAEAGLREALHLVSCEEAVENPAAYLAGVPSRLRAEKEHVLVAARLDIGGRQGVLLLDPGYHVARVVTVMADGLYPHTGEYMESRYSLNVLPWLSTRQIPDSEMVHRLVHAVRRARGAARVHVHTVAGREVRAVDGAGDPWRAPEPLLQPGVHREGLPLRRRRDGAQEHRVQLP